MPPDASKVRFGWSTSDLSVVAGTALTFFAVYLTLEVRRYVEGLATGYDLGIFTQIVKAYSTFAAPTSSLKGPHYNTLGDHFHPILAVLGPLYRAFPSAITLLVLQAAFAALPIVALMRWATDAIGRRAALWIGFSYGLSWGIAALVGFDFHEVAIALPLIAFSVCALGREQWRVAVVWALPLVLVKEDLGLTVAAIGAYVAWKGSRTLGLTLIAFGLGASAVEILVILPSMNPAGHFAYWSTSGANVGVASLVVGVLWPPQKWLTLLMVVGPTGFLALRSPLLLIAMPTLGWRFVSSNPSYWGTHYHYSAILMPIAFAAATHTLATRRRRASPRLAMWCGAAVTAVTVAVYPLHEIASGQLWENDRHRVDADAMLRLIPDGASVASSNRLAARLASRADVSEICLFPRSLPSEVPPEWLIYDERDRTQPPCALSRLITRPHPNLSGYRLVQRRGGITAMRRQPTGGDD